MQLTYLLALLPLLVAADVNDAVNQAQAGAASAVAEATKAAGDAGVNVNSALNQASGMSLSPQPSFPKLAPSKQQSPSSSPLLHLWITLHKTLLPRDY